MYSQNNEDSLFANLFPEVGNLVEIGAFDGKTNSNSLLLIERGWNAVLVEPSPAAFDKILKLHRENNKVHLFNVAVTPGTNRNEMEMLDFYESELSQISTISESFSKNDCVAVGNVWNNPPYRKIVTVGIRIDVLLNEAIRKMGSIDLLSIDVEGLSSMMAMSFDLSKYNIKCICVEIDTGMDYPVEHFYTGSGYTLVGRTPENMIFIRK
jgi:FkbM family methyltransferase